eukprot:10995601-Ditylum_brightwellii.AAC.3
MYQDDRITYQISSHKTETQGIDMGCKKHQLGVTGGVTSSGRQRSTNKVSKWFSGNVTVLPALGVRDSEVL